MSVTSKKAWRERSIRNRALDRLYSQAWKDRQRRPCSECGVLMSYDNSGDRCTKCLNQARRYWTADRIIEALQAFAESHGRRPTARDFRRGGREQGIPTLNSIYGRCGVFETWNDALVAAGFPRPRDGHYVDESTERRREAASRRKQASAGRSSGEAVSPRGERGD